MDTLVGGWTTVYHGGIAASVGNLGLGRLACMALLGCSSGDGCAGGGRAMLRDGRYYVDHVVEGEVSCDAALDTSFSDSASFGGEFYDGERLQDGDRLYVANGDGRMQVELVPIASHSGLSISFDCTVPDGEMAFDCQPYRLTADQLDTHPTANPEWLLEGVATSDVSFIADYSYLPESSPDCIWWERIQASWFDNPS